MCAGRPAESGRSRGSRTKTARVFWNQAPKATQKDTLAVLFGEGGLAFDSVRGRTTFTGQIRRFLEKHLVLTYWSPDLGHTSRTIGGPGSTTRAEVRLCPILDIIVAPSVWARSGSEMRQTHPIWTRRPRLRCERLLHCFGRGPVSAYTVDWGSSESCMLPVVCL